METPPVIKMNTFKYNSSSIAQPPIFFHNTNTMETPQLQYHSASVFSNTANQITYLKPPSQTVVEDAEISIFDAQKYFNDTSDPKTRLSISPSLISTPNPNHDDETTITNNNIINPTRLSCGSAGYNRVRSFHATPTASSEASWNSQTGLLSHPPGGLAVSLRNLPNSKNQERLKGGSVSNASTKWFFRRKCPCSGKKSVQVREPAPNLYTKPQQPDHQHQQLVQQSHERITISSTPSNNLIPPSRYDQFSSKAFQTHQQPRLSGSGRPVSESTTGGFSFPILNSLSLPTKHNSLEEPPRDSLEVFQPVEEVAAPRKAVGGRGFGFPGSPISRVVGLDDDIASDASSDLFEIESFSTQTTSYPMYRRRDSVDEAQNLNTRRLSGSNIYGRRSVDEAMTGSIAPTECYEPSEASIEWSVTTAEGFDRSSVTNLSISASELEEVSMGRNAWMNNGGGRYKKASGGGGLLMSCRQEKAVSVGPQPVRCTVGEGQDGGMAPLMSTLMHVGGRVVENNSNKKKNKQPPLAPSHSARFSRAFAA